jgi:hypothetical protein
LRPLLVAMVAIARDHSRRRHKSFVAAIAAELVDLLERLRGPAARNPECAHELRQRRAARRLAAAAGTNERGGKNGEEDGSHAGISYHH